ncbi:MAG TPA: ATP-dependent helicase [Firmicutes bacterium]|nr:ATP-dependent helicase [Bacillota bacterium]
MNETELEVIKEKIILQHEGDEKQLEVIFSDRPRLIVEAPAGYGKTTTMISRIAYLFATGGVPNPKRILGLTFSVNAALKVKREVAEKLPDLLGKQNNPASLGKKVYVTNYHGFCKGVLKKYGILLSSALRKDVNLFKAIGDGDISRNSELRNFLPEAEIRVVLDMESRVKEAQNPDEETIKRYNQIIANKLLPLGYITHNAVILFVHEIFINFPEVCKFYQSYYPLIVVDEFQDTNCIAWKLLEFLITDKTKLVFLGDPLQRIYGFIGALPDVMDVAATKYNMSKIALAKNYRFRNNPEMLKLDNNIRLNAASCFSPDITDTANLPAFLGKTQKSEANQIALKVKEIASGSINKVAVLFRNRSRGSEIIEECIAENKIPYFYGMFKDEDADYVEFHNTCLEFFLKRFGKAKSIGKKTLVAFADGMKKVYGTKTNKTYDSLIILLYALIEKLSIDYADLPAEDKYNLFIDIFENRQLKQAMEYVNSQVILSTIHGAKGLEWDYVLVADVEQWAFTFVCGQCPSRNSSSQNYCRLPQVIPDGMKKPILDDLCVFYVGLTRARKQAYISASLERFNAQGRQFNNGKVCCLPLIHGIKLIKGNSIG